MADRHKADPAYGKFVETHDTITIKRVFLVLERGDDALMQSYREGGKVRYRVLGFEKRR